MHKETAERIVSNIHHSYTPFVRSPDFGGEHNHYIQVSFDDRIFLIKGQGEPRLSLVEIGLGDSGIGFNTCATGLTALEAQGMLDFFRYP